MKVLDNIFPISFVVISIISFAVLGISDAIDTLFGNLYILMFGLPLYILIFTFSKFIKIDRKITISELYKKQFNKDYKLSIKEIIWDSIFILMILLFFGLRDTVETLWTWWFFAYIGVEIWRVSHSYQIYIDSPNKT